MDKKRKAILVTVLIGIVWIPCLILGSGVVAQDGRPNLPVMVAGIVLNLCFIYSVSRIHKAMGQDCRWTRYIGGFLMCLSAALSHAIWYYRHFGF